jgi:hypothetical protein
VDADVGVGVGTGSGVGLGVVEIDSRTPDDPDAHQTHPATSAGA